jgi:hypothetical protein
MRTGIAVIVLVALLLGNVESRALAEGTAAKAKKAAKPKAQPVALDPSGRPEGSIVDQTARYYVWHDGQGWHLRTTAKVGRNFNGAVRVKDAKIKTFKSVGLKRDNQGKAEDVWRVNDARTELKFQFKTGKLSDGIDLVLDGDAGQIEFELNIDKQKNPRAIFVGRGLQHPATNPFTLPSSPKK